MQGAWKLSTCSNAFLAFLVWIFSLFPWMVKKPVFAVLHMCLFEDWISSFHFAQANSYLWRHLCCTCRGWVGSRRSTLLDACQNLQVPSHASRVHKTWLKQCWKWTNTVFTRRVLLIEADAHSRSKYGRKWKELLPIDLIKYQFIWVRRCHWFIEPFLGKFILCAHTISVITWVMVCHMRSFFPKVLFIILAVFVVNYDRLSLKLVLLLILARLYYTFHLLD